MFYLRHDMIYILHLETSTKNCSVSISKDGVLIAFIEKASENYSHGEQLHPFIEQVVQEAEISLSDLDAIAVSKGPGSYTGLRIGVSAAKGLCFSLQIPLISMSSLEVLEQSIEIDHGYVVPMLDARRMEVYSTVFNANSKIEREIKAEIIDENSFLEYAQNEKVHLVGDGVEKCKEVLKNRNFEFHTSFPSAKNMVKLSYEKYKKSDFEDVAYFEPYYLKDFVVTPQKKKL